MFLSIIIATFNSSKYIERCVDSILNQNFEDFEIIIKDNNSHDDTLSILKDKFNKKKFQNYEIIISNDISVYDAWNIALKKSTGNYIMFLGSDDFLIENALKEYFLYIKENNYPQYIYSQARKIDYRNNYLKSIGQKFNMSHFERHMSVVHTGSIHKKDLFDNYGYFDQNYKIAGDYEFLLRFYKFEKFHFINKELLESTIGGLSEYSIKAQIEGMQAKLKHKTKNILFIYMDTFFIIFKLIIKKLLQYSNVNY